MFIKLEALRDIASRKQYFGKSLAEVFAIEADERFSSSDLFKNFSFYLNRYVNGKWYVFFPDNSFFTYFETQNGFRFEIHSISSPDGYIAFFYSSCLLSS